MVVVTIETGQPVETALDGLRVLDLSHGVAGPFAARLLGDLGAEVIKVEEPGSGDFARRLEPIVPSAPEPEQSLLFQYLNWNKRGITLDLRKGAAHSVLQKLVENSDVIIEAFRPGTLEEWGLGYEQFERWNPNIVLTSVTNFGQTGPYAHYRASDLVLHAMSGIMQISGRVDREPLKHGLRQTLFCAGLNAAYASLAAKVAVDGSDGPGEHVDLSIHECLVSELVLNAPYYSLLGGIQGRRAVVQDPFQGEPIQTKKGFASLQAGGGMPFSDFAPLLGIPELADRFANPRDRTTGAEELRALLEEALADREAIEVFLSAAQKRLLAGFVQTADDLLACPHLEAREFWAEIDHPATGPHRFPGEIIKLSRTPIALRRRSPLLGEHTQEVLTIDLGLPSSEVAALRADAVI